MVDYQTWLKEEDAKFHGSDSFYDAEHVFRLLTPAQIKWCNENIVQVWGVNSKGEIVVSTSVDLKRSRDYTVLPVQFADTVGYFDCGHTALTSLKGVPRRVNGRFNCNALSITSLEYSPIEVGGDFECSFCYELSDIEDLMPLGSGKAFKFNGCDKIPKADIEIIDNKELRKLWMKSRLNLGEFKKKFRGAISGKKFGV